VAEFIVDAHFDVGGDPLSLQAQHDVILEGLPEEHEYVVTLVSTVNLCSLNIRLSNSRVR